MHILNLFGYVLCLAGFGLLAWFSLQVQDMVTKFNMTTLGIAVVGAGLLLVGYLMTTVRSNDYE